MIGDGAERERFRGPLAAAWGERGRARHLRDLLGDAPGLRSRAGVPSLRDRAAWCAVDAPTCNRVRERAELERAAPWPQPLASQYARYFRDGNRTEYEDRVAQRQRRLTRAVLMAAMSPTGEEPFWLDECVDGIALLCEQSSWSWAAHDDTFSARGRVVPTIDAPYLDLGAGEVAAQLAWADLVLGEALDARAPGLRERMRWEAQQRIIGPFLERRDWHWLGLDGNVHNWNPWIHGNVMTAALFLVDDRQRRADAVSLAIEGLDRYLAVLPPDGAIDEGFAYWWNGAGRALEMLQTLEQVTGGALDASDVPVVRELVRFPHRMHVAGDWYVNVADGPARARGDEPWHVPYHWGRRLHDADVVAHAASNRHPGRPLADESAGLGRMLRALFDEAWRDAAPTAPSPVRHAWLPSVQVLVARESAGSAGGLTVAVKGGHNGEHHNHKDVGSFIVAADGRPLLVDAGQPTYTARTFGPDRYGIRTMQSGWHNTPAPGGLEQGAGAQFRATDVQRVAGETSDGLAMRLEAAYPLPPGSRWHRSVVLERGSQSVDVRDSWRLPDPGALAHRGALIHYLLAGPVTLVGDHAVVENPGEGRGLMLRWAAEQGDDGAAASVIATLETWHLDDPLLRGVWGDRLTRLTLDVPHVAAEGACAGALTLAVRLC